MSEAVVADPDWSVWLAAPGPAGVDPEPVDVRTWAERSAAAVFADADVDPLPDDVERLTRWLQLAGDRDYPATGDWLVKWVHLPVWHAVPLVVTCALLGPGDVAHADEPLRALVGGDDPGLVEPPVVEPVTGGLGDGLRGFGYGEARDEDGEQLVAALAYAWAVELDGEPTYVRVATAYQPPRVIAAADDVHALACSLRVERA